MPEWIRKDNLIYKRVGETEAYMLDRTYPSINAAKKVSRKTPNLRIAPSLEREGVKFTLRE